MDKQSKRLADLRELERSLQDFNDLQDKALVLNLDDIFDSSYWIDRSSLFLQDVEWENF